MPRKAMALTVSENNIAGVMVNGATNVTLLALMWKKSLCDIILRRYSGVNGDTHIL